ncbi:MAG: choline-sulfatase [Spirochaetaceae bacterium]|nr:MAG: choline-sulfatase [Spirochaetaceae bacterium]
MSATSPEQPNILFFMPDQWRPDFLGFVGSVPVRTPTVDRLAASGTVFTRATTPSPLCAPARSCLASGMSYRKSPVPNNGVDFPIDRPTLYSHLRDAGYQVGSVGKLDLHKATLDWGLDGKRSMSDWGFTHGLDSEGKLDAMQSYLKNGRQPRGPYMQFLAERGLADLHADDFRTRDQWLGVEPTELPDDAYCDNWIGANGLDVLDSFDTGRPWFLVANFTGPHNPQDVTASMLDLYAGVDFPPPIANTTVDAPHMQQIRRNYAAMCENIDSWLARYLDAVSRRDDDRPTIVVFASDHGEMLGDHDQWGKSIWRQPSIGIPMIVAGPGVSRGTSDALVQLQDLAPTFLDLADAAQLPDADASSLADLLYSRSDATGRGAFAREHALSGLNAWDCVWDGRYKLVLDNGEPAGLYDHQSDPDELHDLLGTGDPGNNVAIVTRLLGAASTPV